MKQPLCFLSLVCITAYTNNNAGDFSLYPQETPQKNNEILFLQAVKQGNFSFMQQILDTGLVSPDLQDEHRITPLLWAIEQRAFCNAHPMHKTIAIRHNYLQMIKLLIARQANLSFSNTQGITPLLMAASYGDMPVVELLIHHKAVDQRIFNETIAPACPEHIREQVKRIITNSQSLALLWDIF